MDGQEPQGKTIRSHSSRRSMAPGTTRACGPLRNEESTSPPRSTSQKSSLLNDLEKLRTRYKEQGGSNPVILQRMEQMQNEVLRSEHGANGVATSPYSSDMPPPQPAPGLYPPQGYYGEYGPYFTPYNAAPPGWGDYPSNPMYGGYYGMPAAASTQQQLWQVRISLYSFIMATSLSTTSMLVSMLIAAAARCREQQAPGRVRFHGACCCCTFLQC